MRILLQMHTKPLPCAGFHGCSQRGERKVMLVSWHPISPSHIGSWKSRKPAMPVWIFLSTSKRGSFSIAVFLSLGPVLYSLNGRISSNCSLWGRVLFDLNSSIIGFVQIWRLYLFYQWMRKWISYICWLSLCLFNISIINYYWPPLRKW